MLRNLFEVQAKCLGVEVHCLFNILDHDADVIELVIV